LCVGVACREHRTHGAFRGQFCEGPLFQQRTGALVSIRLFELFLGRCGSARNCPFCSPALTLGSHCFHGVDAHCPSWFRVVRHDIRRGRLTRIANICFPRSSSRMQRNLGAAALSGKVALAILSPPIFFSRRRSPASARREPLSYTTPAVLKRGG